MGRDREERIETNFWGDERRVIYEDGERVGEIETESRGGFFGFGGEDVDVEYDNDRNEVSYTTTEERGGFLGIGGEEARVTYDSNSHDEISNSKLEDAGGFLGFGSHVERVVRDPGGDRIGQIRHEKRGEFLGFGGEKVRVSHYENSTSEALSRASGSSSSWTGSESGQITSGADSTGWASLRGFFVCAIVVAAIWGLYQSPVGQNYLAKRAEEKAKAEEADRISSIRSWVGATKNNDDLRLREFDKNDIVVLRARVHGDLREEDAFSFYITHPSGAIGKCNERGWLRTGVWNLSEGVVTSTCEIPNSLGGALETGVWTLSAATRHGPIEALKGGEAEWKFTVK